MTSSIPHMGVQTRAAGGDPYFANVVLLAINDNAADGTTTFVDQSSYARTLTTVGNAAYTNATAPVGMSTCAVLDGTGDGVTAADAAELEPGSSDFTCEVFFRPTSVTGTDILISKDNAGGFSPFLIRRSGTTLQWFASANGTTWGVADTLTVGTVAINTWYYAALKRSGTAFTCCLNGTAGTGATSASALVDTTTSFNIGRYPSFAGFDWEGNVACVRYTVGVARDISATPTIPFQTS